MTKKKDRRAKTPFPVDDERRANPRDRRQFPRVLLNLEVDYKSEDTFLFAYITDISAVGIFVRTNEPEPAGTRLNLSFRTPNSAERFECEGVVIWINPYRPGDRENLNPGMGIKFVDLAPGQRAHLSELVKTFAYLTDDEDDKATSKGQA